MFNHSRSALHSRQYNQSIIQTTTSTSSRSSNGSSGEGLGKAKVSCGRTLRDLLRSQLAQGSSHRRGTRAPTSCQQLRVPLYLFSLYTTRKYIFLTSFSFLIAHIFSFINTTKLFKINKNYTWKKKIQIHRQHAFIKQIINTK